MKQTKSLSINREPITALNLHPHNARQGDVGAICQSLEAHGQYRPLVVQRSTGNVLAGNHTLQAAQALGWTEVDVTYIDVDDDQALRILLVDNRANDLATYDNSVLTDLLEALVRSDFGLEGTGFDGSDLDDLLAEFQDDTIAEVKDEDELPAIPTDPVTKAGDVWLLGPHRLICGDSTVILPTLPKFDALISDPPYGMGFDASWYGSEKYPSEFAKTGAAKWDAEPFDPAFMFATSTSTFALFGANYFCTRLPEDGTWWVWDKRTSEEADALLGIPFELLWMNGKRAHKFIRYNWAAFTAKERDEPEKRHHPTQKPIEVMARIIEYLTKPSESVVDPFSGAGATLLACERLQRVCTAIELDPAYCDVIAKRYQRATGTVPILETTGKPHSFLD